MNHKLFQRISWFVWALSTALGVTIFHFYGWESGLSVFAAYFLGGADATFSIFSRDLKTKQSEAA